MIRLAAAATAAAAAALLAGPAFAAERSYPVGSFDRIALEGSPEVSVTTGRAASVRATGDADALDHLDVRVDNATLKIGHKREGWNWSWSSHPRIRFVVTVPALRAVDVAGSGDVSVDRVRGHEFAANIAGSGSLTLAALDADTTSFNVSGSGTVTAAGRCGTGSAKVSGSGELKLAALRCTALSAAVAGSGSIDAFATGSATLATMGSGDITLTGGARCTTSTAGSGRVRCS